MADVETVVVDQKKRIRLPKKVSDALQIKSKEILSIAVEDGKIVVSRPRKDLPMSPMLRDMIERPFHTKVKITTELLEKIGESQWE